MPVVVVISQHLLNVFVQLANKRGFKKKKSSSWCRPFVGYHENEINRPLHSNGHLANITDMGDSHNGYCGENIYVIPVGNCTPNFSTIQPIA
jgi:hypothetical protein